MTRGEVSRYFRILSKFFHEPCRVIVTGAAAGALYGRIRSTRDIDFAIQFKTCSGRRKDKLWNAFRSAAQEATLRTRIVVQYAEDIDRWSSITYLNYADHTKPFAVFGRINVRLLEPGYWAIGKFSRYLDPDVRDLVEVLRKTKTSWRTLAAIQGRALKMSPKSTACFQFRKQVEDFLTRYGRKIWGKSYRPEQAIAIFRRQAGIVS